MNNVPFKIHCVDLSNLVALNALFNAIIWAKHAKYAKFFAI